MTWLLQAGVVALSVTGAFFFVAGTVGLLRFPDTYIRLHAVAKADNLGLGLVTLAVALHSGSVVIAGKLLLIWLLALLVSSNACFVIGRWARAHAEGQEDGDHG